MLNPADLAKILNDAKSKKPILLSIGFGGGIKISKETGATKEKEGIENLKKELAKLPKDADIVIYCGCCPFKDCPNIRPAFKILSGTISSSLVVDFPFTSFIPSSFNFIASFI